MILKEVSMSRLEVLILLKMGKEFKSEQSTIITGCVGWILD
jgi:hypothetical protein